MFGIFCNCCDSIIEGDCVVVGDPENPMRDPTDPSYHVAGWFCSMRCLTEWLLGNR